MPIVGSSHKQNERARQSHLKLCEPDKRIDSDAGKQKMIPSRRGWCTLQA